MQLSLSHSKNPTRISSIVLTFAPKTDEMRPKRAGFSLGTAFAPVSP